VPLSVFQFLHRCFLWRCELREGQWCGKNKGCCAEDPSFLHSAADRTPDAVVVRESWHSWVRLKAQVTSRSVTKSTFHETQISSADSWTSHLLWIWARRSRGAIDLRCLLGLLFWSEGWDGGFQKDLCSPRSWPISLPTCQQSLKSAHTSFCEVTQVLFPHLVPWFMSPVYLPGCAGSLKFCFDVGYRHACVLQSLPAI